MLHEAAPLRLWLRIDNDHATKKEEEEDEPVDRTVLVLWLSTWLCRRCGRRHATTTAEFGIYPCLSLFAAAAASTALGKKVLVKTTIVEKE